MKYLRYVIVLIIVGAIVSVGLSAAYGWLLGQNIYLTMFLNKADVNYWETWTLQNNIFYASALLAILSSVFTLWTRSTFLSFMSALSQTGPTLKRLSVKTGVVWRLFLVGAFFLYYVSTGGYSVTGQNVAFLMMLSADGSISMTPGDLGMLFTLPFTPGISASSIQSLIPAMEAYQLYVGLISTLLVATAARFVLSILTDLMMKRPDTFRIVSKGLLVVSLVLGIEILGVPMWTVNAGTWMSYLALIIALAASLFGSFVFVVMRVRSGDARQRLGSKIASLENDLVRLQGEMLSLRQEYEAGAITADNYRNRVGLLMEDRSNISNELRRLKIERMLPIGGSPRNFALLSAFLVIIVVMLPITQAFYYGIQMEGDRYIDWKFNMETAKEIEITNWAAGLDEMRTRDINDLLLNATPATQVETLASVRQWDQQASYLRMRNQIGVNWMQLADSDIVYLKGHEYWVAPLTFDTRATWTTFLNQHILYTHTEGLIVLDAYSGEIVANDDLVVLLNRTESVNFYYGEGRGFSGAVFVNVESFEEVGNVTFSADPDYTLRGLESWFFMFSMGPSAWSYLGREMDMLLERDVMSRVSSVMLQGLTVDRDPYIVFSPSGRLYYALSIFIDYNLATGYAHENYMRFMGVSLIDIETGEMEFYESPAFGDGFFLDATYREYYEWQECPSWLEEQMRWPEDLYERQLDVAFIYHVNQAEIWSNGVDFHEAPIGTDVRYIIMTINGEERFIAYHNAEFKNSPAHNLAGIYIMGCGSKNFGELVFYKAGEEGRSTWLGPTAVVQAFETNDVVRTQLQLWGSHRYGNRLVYHLGGELFFVVPVFLEVQTTVDRVIEKLGGVGLVDAKTGERVKLGSNVVEAYYAMFGLLNQTIVEEGEVGLESVTLEPLSIREGEFASLIVLMRNNDNVSRHLYLDVIVPASANFSLFWHGAEVSSVAGNFTLDIGMIGPGDLYGTAPVLTAYLGEGQLLVQYLVQIVLRTDEGVVDTFNVVLTVR